MINFLRVTNFTPYSKMLMPYSRWVDNMAMYLSRGRNLAPIEDLILFASALVHVTEDVLLSPAESEKHICALPYFPYFRNKEMWLDVFHQLITKPEYYCLTSAEIVLMKEKLFETGDTGPEPQRLLQFLEGHVSSKAPFSRAEQTEFQELDKQMHLHFQARFGTQGKIQGYFKNLRRFEMRRRYFHRQQADVLAIGW